MTIEEKERRVLVIRGICGSYYKGACDGKCVECLAKEDETENSAIDSPLDNQ